MDAPGSYGHGQRGPLSSRRSSSSQPVAGCSYRTTKIITLFAGILRLANALDDEHDGQIQRIKVNQNSNYILIQAQGLRQDSMLAENIAERHLLEINCGVPVSSAAHVQSNVESSCWMNLPMY